MMHSDEKEALRGYRWPGPLLFVLGLVLFGLTLCRGPHPGLSAMRLVQYGGLGPFPPMTHIVWWGLVQGFSALPLGSLHGLLNAFSALCGAAILWMVYDLTAGLAHSRTEEERRTRADRPSMRILSGATAALFLAFSRPFWNAVTHANPDTFALALLLGCALLLRAYRQSGRTSLLYALAVLYGLGGVDSPYFLFAAPFFAFYALSGMLWHTVGNQAETLRLKHLFRRLRTPLLVSSLCLLAGTLPFFFYAAWYRHQPSFAWREFHGTLHVLWQMAKAYVQETSKSVPTVGWMLIALVTAFPFVYTVIAFKKGGRNGSRLLHGVLGAVMGLLLLLPVLAPDLSWGFDAYLAAPYTLAALTAGYLAGYALILFQHIRPFEARWLSGVRRMLAVAWLPLLAALFAAAAWINGSFVVRGNRSAAWPLAQDIVEASEGCSWLLSNGEMDDLIVLAAAEKGRPLHVLNPRLGGSEPYLAYLASLSDDPRFKGRARLGLLPLLNDWLARDPKVTEQLAIVSTADLWLAGGYGVLPDRAVYRGTAPDASGPPPGWMEAQRAQWARYEKQTDPVGANPRRNPIDYWAYRVRSAVSKMANNSGVYLADHGRPDEAMEAYAAARRLKPDNLSALLNQLSLAAERAQPEEQTFRDELDTILRRRETPPNAWALAYYDGYVRRPEWYAQRGMAWAISGKPNLAVAEIKRAMAMGLRQDAAHATLAEMYLTQDRPQDSEAEWLKVLETNPRHVQAVTGLFQNALYRRDFDAAHGYLLRLRELEVDALVLRRHGALMAMLTGQPDLARAELKAIVKAQPDNLAAWMLAAVLAADEQNREALDAAAEQINRQLDKAPQATLRGLARLYLAQRDTARARDYLLRALRRQPADVQAMEMLLRIATFEARKDEAEALVRQLLTVDPLNAFGNLVLGSLQFTRGEYAQAEASFRQSLERERNALVLNELAFTLFKLRRYPEAETLARESIRIDSRQGGAWDTLGASLLHLNRLDEAGEALQKALALLPEHPEIIFHMAEWYARKGLRAEAMALLQKLMDRPSVIGTMRYEEARTLMAQLRQEPREGPSPQPP